VGDVFREQGDYAAAIDSFQSALAIVEKLAEADPSNTGWQLDLAISLARLGEVSLDQGNTLRAVSEFQKAHAIFGRLGQSDPANVGWQSNLATSHAKLALAQRKNGELRDALDNAKDYLGTAERRLQLDPGNIVWQGHVATGLELAGEILVEMKNAPEAFERYTAALAIRERLATTEYGSSNVAQRYLADLHGRLAVLLAQRQQREQALSNLRRGRDIIVDLQGRPALQLSAKVMADLKSREWFEQQIAELEKK
jgi:tetratricopeptide (TPR) repeat protein